MVTSRELANAVKTAARAAGHIACRGILEAGSRMSGISSTLADPTNARAARSRLPSGITDGIVIRSGLGSYDCEVQVGSHRIFCASLVAMVHQSYGVSQASIPTPGSSVLVYVRSLEDGTPASPGYILGVLPEAAPLPYSNGESVVNTFGLIEAPEGGVSPSREDGHSRIATDTDYVYHGDYRFGRPVDLVPGEYAVMNHAGGGLMVGMLSTQVSGSSLSSVRCSALDDQVRVTAGHYQLVTSVGTVDSYCDGPYATVETCISPYYHERTGVPRKETRPFIEESTKEAIGDATHMGLKQDKGQTAISRIKSFTGYLGDLVNFFVVHPGISGSKNTMQGSTNEQGLMHTHVDSSGRVCVRSASGIILERYDRIPVPRRVRQAWDPEGDHGENAPTGSKPYYNYQREFPGAIGLLMGDMAAWYNSQAYTRFDGFKKDFTLKTQRQLRQLDRRYDDTGNGTSRLFEQFDKRHSYFGLTEDGGIVLRDAWGSEIVMQGGNITLNAVGDIFTRPGRSAVTLAGDDAIVKARNSVDITSTDRDVRVKARYNMQLMSAEGGVLIESQAKSDLPVAWDKVGEDLRSCGVILHAKDSSVRCIGKTTHLSGSSAVSIETFARDSGSEPEKLSGIVRIASENIDIAASGRVRAVGASGESGLFIESGSVSSFASTVSLIARGSVDMMSGDKRILGIPVDSEERYSGKADSGKKMFDGLAVDTAWLKPFAPDMTDGMSFRFRASKQYSLDQPDHDAPGFKLYQPAWVNVARRRPTWLSSIITQTWTERPDTFGEYPWPGKSAYKAKTYVMGGESNITSDHVESVSLAGGTAVLTPSPFSGYHIRAP